MANGKQKIWVSDIIGEDYKKWHNEFVVLDCGTACGKTFFCVRKLGKYAALKGRNILYLCNLYIPTTESRLHGVLVHAFRSFSALFPVW